MVATYTGILVQLHPEFVFTWHSIFAQDVSITLTPRPSTMASQAGLLNSAYFFVWGRICKTRLDNWCLISHWIQSTARFLVARVVRSRYLVLLYIFYVLLNVHDKNLLYDKWLLELLFTNWLLLTSVQLCAALSSFGITNIFVFTLLYNWGSWCYTKFSHSEVHIVDEGLLSLL